MPAPDRELPMTEEAEENVEMSESEPRGVKRSAEGEGDNAMQIFHLLPEEPESVNHMRVGNYA